MHIYRVNGELNYYTMHGNLKTTRVENLEVKATSDEQDQQREAILKWLQTGPMGITNNDVVGWRQFQSKRLADPQA